MQSDDPKNDAKEPITTEMLTALAGLAAIAARHTRLNTPKRRGNK